MFLIRLFTLIIFLGFSFSGFSQCINHNDKWGDGNVFTYDVKRDDFGNIYMALSFYESTTIAGRFFDGTLHPNNLLIIKLDKNQELQWAIHSGTEEYAGISEIVVTPDNDIILAGGFTSSISLGCVDMYDDTQNSTFLARISKYGDVVWAVNSGGERYESIRRLGVNSKGEVLFSGVYGAGFSLAGTTLNYQELPNQTLFIGKITADGQLLWMRDFKNSGYHNVFDLVIDSHDNLLITGTWTGPEIDFGGAKLNVPDDPGVEWVHHFYLTKFDDRGEALWARSSDNKMGSEGWGITLDSDDNVYATGSFYSGDIEIEGNILTNQGAWDYYLSKYSTSGELRWIKSIGGINAEYLSKLATKPNGNLLMSGSFEGEIAIGDAVFAGDQEYSEQSFIIEFDPDGSFLCTQAYQADFQLQIYKLYMDPLGNLITTRDIDYSYNEVHFYDERTNWPDDPISYDGLDINLGENVEICEGETVALEVSQFGSCAEVTYTWKGGSKDPVLMVNEPGRYWVEVTAGNKIGSDTIEVFQVANLTPLHLEDRQLCADASIAIDVYDENATKYAWSTGGDKSRLVIDEPGEYWVNKSNECFHIISQFSVASVAPIEVELGEDRVICNTSEQIVLNADNPGAGYNWNTGADTPQIIVGESKVYSVSVFNECETVTDQVRIDFLDVEDQFIPNVITPNGDGKNEYFLLPENWTDVSLKILTRWGKPVYQVRDYQNTWNAFDQPAGVYYYKIELEGCDVEPILGSLHVMK